MEMLKRLLYWVDNRFNIRLTDKAIQLQSFWKNSALINKCRHNINYFIIKTNYKLGASNNKKNCLKLNLGCGSQRFEGYINIDFRKTKAVDVVCNIMKLPYPNNSVWQIEAHHVIEHLSRHELYIAMKEWQRVLIKGGVLIIECPDFDAAVQEYLDGNEQRLDNIFGNQEFHGDLHQFGYNFDRLKKIVETLGFGDVQKKTPTGYHVQEEPCLRIECVKI